MSNEYSSLELNRLEKLERLRSQGHEPYPTRTERSHTSQQAIRLFEAAEAAAAEIRPRGSTPASFGGIGRAPAGYPPDGQDHLRAY